jgi:CRISPR-associated endonuclease/helicase Cas3
MGCLGYFIIFSDRQPHGYAKSIQFMKPQFAAHTPPENSDQWHELKHHLRDVSDVVGSYAAKFGAAKLGEYAGLWHDLGKYNPKFQAYLEKCYAAKMAGQKPPREKVPHAIYGAFLAYDLKCTPRFGLSFLIAGHHAGLSNFSDLKSDLNNPLKRADYLTVKQHGELEINDLKPSEDLSLYFKRFTSDRIAEELFLRLVFSCLIDADRLDTEKFANLEQYQLRQERTNAVTIEQLWKVFERKQKEFVNKSIPSNTQVYQVRTEVYQHCVEAAGWKPGIFRLCVPTGGGKTRSGLAFALKHAKEYVRIQVLDCGISEGID